jgi:HK97 family phage major capsid protein
MSETRHREAFLRYLSRGPAAISSDDARVLHEQRGVTGTASGLAPSDWASFFTESMQTSWVLGRVRKVEVTSNKLTVAHYNESFETGDRISYDEEGARADINGSFELPRWKVTTGSAPAGFEFPFENRAITLHEVGVNMIVSKELIEDSIGSVSAETVLRDFLIRKLQTEIERQVLVGDPSLNTNSRKEFQGILNYPLYYNAADPFSPINERHLEDAAGITINGYNYSGALIKLRPSSMTNAVWVFHRRAASEGLTPTRDFMQPATQAGSIGSIFGLPAFINSYSNYQGDYDLSGRRGVMAVDLSKYVLAMHTSGLQVERLNEVRAGNGQVILRATARVGGNMIDNKSIVGIMASN